MLKNSVVAALAAVLVAGSWAAPASANLDLDEMAALLALPYITLSGESATTTEIVITNGLEESINLHFNILGDNWNSASFDCPVTARETTHITVTGGPGGATFDLECSASGADENSVPEDLNIETTELHPSANGILVVAVEQGGVSVSKNAIFGDATIINPEEGMAYSVSAVSFQGLDPLNNNGDAQYKFDGLEYAQFASSHAVNFLAPGPRRTASLIVFTLDGTAGHTPVPVSVRVLFYNDDEKERDTKFDFDCFDIIELDEVDPRFSRSALGSASGHMTMTPEAVRVETVHELTGDPLLGPNDFRISPLAGWLVQTFSWEDSEDVAASAHSFAQSVNAFAALPGDVVNFNAAR